MFSFKVLMVLAACLPWSYCKLDKYCSLCEDHTMCKYSGPGKACKDIGDSGVSEKDKAAIVNVHNWVRRLVASGYELRGKGGHQPQAANLRKLVWDDDLARVAQRWADQCKFQHDTCRNDPRWNVGQNLYWNFRFPANNVNWTEAILSWHDEVAKFNPQHVHSYRFSPATGHYTQVLWHDTEAVGCGRRDYGNNKIYVCNYGPAGNQIGEPLYAIGKPCSKCPKGTICDNYLCALSGQSIKPSNDDEINITEDWKRTDEVKQGKKVEKTETQKHSVVPVVPKKKPEEKDPDEDNEIILDEATQKEIDRIHKDIEKLLKNFIKKCKNMKECRRD